MIRQLSETKTLTAEGALNRQPRTLENHSSRSQDQHVHYHAHILGGRQSSARLTDQLNPDDSVSERARTQGRRFPGLAN